MTLLRIPSKFYMVSRSFYDGLMSARWLMVLGLILFLCQTKTLPVAWSQPTPFPPQWGPPQWPDPHQTQPPQNLPQPTRSLPHSPKVYHSHWHPHHSHLQHAPRLADPAAGRVPPTHSGSVQQSPPFTGSSRPAVQPLDPIPLEIKLPEIPVESTVVQIEATPDQTLLIEQLSEQLASTEKSLEDLQAELNKKDQLFRETLERLLAAEKSKLAATEEIAILNRQVEELQKINRALATLKFLGIELDGFID